MMKERHAFRQEHECELGRQTINDMEDFEIKLHNEILKN